MYTAEQLSNEVDGGTIRDELLQIKDSKFRKLLEGLAVDRDTLYQPCVVFHLQIIVFLFVRHPVCVFCFVRCSCTCLAQ